MALAWLFPTCSFGHQPSAYFPEPPLQPHANLSYTCVHTYVFMAWGMLEVCYCFVLFAVTPRVGIWWLIIGTLCFLYDL